MKKIFGFIMASLLLCCCRQEESLVLHPGDEYIITEWTLNQEGSETFYDVEVPSTVAGVLAGKGSLR